ncbi:MAG: DNA recombination protein RmuC [Acholeplasma sp.]|nr:DNA recombination protein RmuC [Acholeplasma sp.]
MIEYVILGLLVLNIILIIYLIIKNINKNKNQDTFDQNDLKLYLKDEYSNLKIEMLKIVNEYSEKSVASLVTFKDAINKHVNDQLGDMNKQVETKLNESFSKTQETFTNVVERLTKIDEAQKNIEKLSTEVYSLNNILIDKKTRGIFGEVQLHQLLSAVLGDNDKLYQEQKQLSNGKIVDAIIHAPSPLGSIAVDSKFPLNSYQKIVESVKDDENFKSATKQFKIDIKKHIKDIAEKYIISGETADQAIMFIPAEAIFSELISKHSDLIEEASKNKVWIVSPTTLISTLTIIQTVVKNMERDRQSSLIVEELKILSNEFRLYAERWMKLERTAETLTSDIKDINITTNKITKKFRSIEQGKLDYKEED